MNKLKSKLIDEFYKEYTLNKMCLKNQIKFNCI